MSNNNPDTVHPVFESLPNISTCSLKAVTTKRAGLGAITGNAKELSDASTRKVLGGNEWVVLPAEDGYSSHIFVDLAASPQLGLSIEYASDVEVPEELVEKQLSTVLKDYFIKEIRAIHYTLAVVDNVKPSNGPTDLVLKSFHFTTLGTSDTALYLDEGGGTTDSQGQFRIDPLQITLAQSVAERINLPPCLLNGRYFANTWDLDVCLLIPLKKDSNLINLDEESFNVADWVGEGSKIKVADPGLLPDGAIVNEKA
ncbi:hypothetical protein V8E55_004202 [Tylopilus felleus]